MDQPDLLCEESYCPCCGGILEFDDITLLGGDDGFSVRCPDCTAYGVGPSISAARSDAGGGC